MLQNPDIRHNSLPDYYRGRVIIINIDVWLTDDDDKLFTGSAAEIILAYFSRAGLFLNTNVTHTKHLDEE